MSGSPGRRAGLTRAASPAVSGVVTRAVGLSVDVAGLDMAVGEAVTLTAAGGPVLAEVVALHDGHATCMPVSDLRGVRRGDRVVTTGGPLSTGAADLTSRLDKGCPGQPDRAEQADGEAKPPAAPPNQARGPFQFFGARPGPPDRPPQTLGRSGAAVGQDHDSGGGIDSVGELEDRTAQRSSSAPAMRPSGASRHVPEPPALCHCMAGLARRRQGLAAGRQCGAGLRRPHTA